MSRFACIKHYNKIVDILLKSTSLTTRTRHFELTLLTLWYLYLKLYLIFDLRNTRPDKLLKYTLMHCYKCI